MTAQTVPSGVLHGVSWSAARAAATTGRGLVAGRDHAGQVGHHRLPGERRARPGHGRALADGGVGLRRPRPGQRGHRGRLVGRRAPSRVAGRSVSSVSRSASSARPACCSAVSTGSPAPSLSAYTSRTVGALGGGDGEPGRRCVGDAGRCRGRWSRRPRRPGRARPATAPPPGRRAAAARWARRDRVDGDDRALADHPAVGVDADQRQPPGQRLRVRKPPVYRPAAPGSASSGRATGAGSDVPGAAPPPPRSAHADTSSSTPRAAGTTARIRVTCRRRAGGRPGSTR